MSSKEMGFLNPNVPLSGESGGVHLQNTFQFICLQTILMGIETL